MYDIILSKLEERKNNPLEVVVSGMGFVSFGFISALQNMTGIRVPLVISRRPEDAKKLLSQKGFKVKLSDNPSQIKDFSKKGYISISSDIDLVSTYENDLVCEMTGTVSYAAEVALRAMDADKHLITMNPELQATLGSELKVIADKKKLVITDIIGDQPGSIARLITQARLMGFKILVAGNMKRYMNKHATVVEMTPWAKDKGLAPRQTVSFTDGTKQSIEMNLVANYFDMDILEFGMRGPQVEEVHEGLKLFDFNKIPDKGIVDYVIGKKLFPGVFVIVEHPDTNQKLYLRYLGMGDGPRYILFEPYHLIHLEVPGTIAKVAFFGQETINNRVQNTRSIAVAKFNLTKGSKIDGIGGDTVYGVIDRAENSEDYLPIGLSEGAIVKHTLHQDQPIKISDVELPVNSATILSGLIKPQKKTPAFPFDFRFAHLL
ncbi:hypothetical protein HYT02_03070 [Candidatus Gottesmanbacteria bacterium]|nr:hypothetical protein [Candidatus Gottesmanbacteria bacterium]